MDVNGLNILSFVFMTVFAFLWIGSLMVFSRKMQADASLMLRGPIQNEGEALIKLLQGNIGSDGDKIFTPLKNFCNQVCCYIRLGGTFSMLNEKLVTIARMLASSVALIRLVKFDPDPELKNWAIVTIGGDSGCRFKFDLNYLDSLVKIRGS